MSFWVSCLRPFGIFTLIWSNTSPLLPRIAKKKKVASSRLKEPPAGSTAAASKTSADDASNNADLVAPTAVAITEAVTQDNRDEEIAQLQLRILQLKQQQENNPVVTGNTANSRENPVVTGNNAHSRDDELPYEVAAAPDSSSIAPIVAPIVRTMASPTVYVSLFLGF